MVPLPSSRQRIAVVVGAGPVGCLTAIMLATRGWKVKVYESRADLRLPVVQANTRQRSINFTISHRGIAALEAIYPEAAERFIRNVSIPMRGRMIHHADGRSESQPYDRHGQCINSCDRALLNVDLLDQVCKTDGIEVYFRHKVRAIDFDKRNMVVEDLDQADGERTKTVEFHLCVGADGSYSTVRREMMKVVRMDFQQEYIDHEYMELRMAPGPKKTFLLDPNHLHIWPRQSFMLIAMANRDCTFTCTLFAPRAQFEKLDTPERFLEWFKGNFPDALQAIGEESLLRDYLSNPRNALICTKANPYHYKDRGILLGDAAHSMVPFYGQGLNCGMEDVRVLKILFDKERVQTVVADFEQEDERLTRALARFSEERHQDLIAITDLAKSNYIELRHLVATPMYLLRKVLDSWLHSLSEAKPLSALSELLGRELYDAAEPKAWDWLPLYTMVTFRPDISYDQVRRKALTQASVLTWLGYFGMVILGFMCWCILRVTWRLFGLDASWEVA